MTNLLTPFLPSHVYKFNAEDFSDQHLVVNQGCRSGSGRIKKQFTKMDPWIYERIQHNFEAMVSFPSTIFNNFNR